LEAESCPDQQVDDEEEEDSELLLLVVISRGRRKVKVLTRPSL
jgi:hypothetical protein